MRTQSIAYKVNKDTTIFECSGDYGTMDVTTDDKLFTDLVNTFMACDTKVEELIANQPKPVSVLSIMITWYDENKIVVLDTLGIKYNLDNNGAFRFGRWLGVIGKVDNGNISILVYNLSGPIETSKYRVVPNGHPAIINVFLQGDQEFITIELAKVENPNLHTPKPEIKPVETKEEITSSNVIEDAVIVDNVNNENK